MTFYNEFDAQKAAWLRELMNAGEITTGEVDERSIKDLRASELTSYGRRHFFAGIGVWDYALRLAGWPIGWPIWTASCPCQPFSAAGRRGGTQDDRHLWPDFFGLVRKRLPPVIIGEQVASPDGLKWFDGPQEGLCELRDRQAVLRVLRKLQGGAEKDMRRLPKGEVEESQAGQPRAHQASIFRLEEAKARLCAGCGRKIQGEDQEASIQPGPVRHTGASGGRRVRINWDSIFTERAKGVERSLFGPSGAIFGLRDGECQGGDLCPECDGEYMGTTEDCGDCVGDFEGARSGEPALDLISWGKDEEVDAKYSFGTVRGDLESAGYTVGVLDTCAAGVGAPHLRQRLYWCGLRIDGLADAYGKPSERNPGGVFGAQEEVGRSRGQYGDFVDGHCCGSATQRVGDAAGSGSSRGGERNSREEARGRRLYFHGDPRFTHGYWSRPNWVLTRPQRVGDLPGLRPVEPGALPLADGTPARVGRLRGYGDAIVAQQAAAFIRCVMEEIEAAR